MPVSMCFSIITHYVFRLETWMSILGNLLSDEMTLTLFTVTACNFGLMQYLNNYEKTKYLQEMKKKSH